MALFTRRFVVVEGTAAGVAAAVGAGYGLYRAVDHLKELDLWARAAEMGALSDETLADWLEEDNERRITINSDRFKLWMSSSNETTLAAFKKAIANGIDMTQGYNRGTSDTDLVVRAFDRQLKRVEGLMQKRKDDANPKFTP
jgi:hypothetical protein